jgi:DNA-binding XRE family transcriptional regulator
MASEAYKAKAQGRQRAAILEYKIKNTATYEDMAELIGVHKSTIEKWCNENRPANWELLAKIGIQKPEGLD